MIEDAGGRLPAYRVHGGVRKALVRAGRIREFVGAHHEFGDDHAELGYVVELVEGAR